jgi:hypothetical protein
MPTTNRHDIDVDFVSARVGNYQFKPQWSAAEPALGEVAPYAVAGSKRSFSGLGGMRVG